MATNLEWAQAVIVHLNVLDKELLHAATSANEDECGEPPPAPADEFLSWLRGDEPWDTMNDGENPQDYAVFLIEEWKLFGAQGE